MKTLTILSIVVLGAALGCQSATSPVVNTANAGTQNESAVNTQTAAETDDHSHDEAGDKAAPRVSIADAKKAFDDGEAIFVDTRAASFFANEHVKGAVNVPASDFENTYKSVPKDKKIIAYCS